MNQPGPLQHILVKKLALAAFIAMLVVVVAACNSGSNVPTPPSIPDQDEILDGWSVETSEYIDLADALTATATTGSSSGSQLPTPPAAIAAATPPAAIAAARPIRPTPRPPTESFTVHDLDIEPKTGTRYETLLARLPDNQMTRNYTRLIDFTGTVDAMGLDRPVPGFNQEERENYYRYLIDTNVDVFWGAFGSWPAGQRDYPSLINTYPDLAFDWASVEASAYSGASFFSSFSGGGSGIPTTYDIALGQFDPEKTQTALRACDCDQPDVREHEGIEYMAWGEGNGIGSIKDRYKPPFYDHIGRGPLLLVRDGEAYYSIKKGVMDELIEVIQGIQPSLADTDGYVEAVQLMASLGIVSEIAIRSTGFTTEEVANSRPNLKFAITEDIEAIPLLQPFEFAATGTGYDGDRIFTGLVIAHNYAETAVANRLTLLARLETGVAYRQGPGRSTPWTQLVDRVDIQVYDRFIVARIYFTRPGGLGSLVMPNTLLVHD